MKALRAALVATAALIFCASASLAQSARQTAAQSLPPGLKQQGNVIMMAPISEKPSERGVAISAERRPGSIRYLSASDRDLYLRAFEAAERGDWTAARGLAGQGHDAIAQRLIEWRYLLDKNSGATFGEISAFLKTNPDWPARDDLFARAEAAMDPNMEPHAMLAFFAGRDPVSDIGKIRLGEGYLATGSTAKGRELIRQAWIGGSFDLNQEYDIVRRHGDILTPDVDRARLNRLLFNNDVTAARRELARVPPDTQQVAQVRLTLRDNPWRGRDVIAQLPPQLQSDPGLLFDRAKVLRQQNAVDAIPPLLSRTPTREMASINPGLWWSELNQAARAAIQLRSYQTAHELAAYSGLSSGPEFADAEFLAGWLDLRFLHNPKEAHTHFANIGRAVTRPISRSRGYYWAARASEAAGDIAQASQDYRAAAQFPETFYGQLALAKLDPKTALHLRTTAIETGPTEEANYEKHELTHAIHVLGDLGLVSLLRTFASYDAENHPEPKHLELLASDLVKMGFKDIAVRVAKTASYSGITLLGYSHPVISIPVYSGPGYPPDAAFVLGIIRQETEFDPMAVSGSGARGLMQLMPSSARRDADMAGIAYRANDLLSDASYNMRLGMVELAGDLATYTGSYLLAAAAYNAGKANVNKWLDMFGDPRSPTVDPIDWIEEIPFTETRNYVQRVMESMEVYRNRLSGRDEPLRILTDLYRPRQPELKSLPESAVPARADATRARSPVARE